MDSAPILGDDGEDLGPIEFIDFASASATLLSTFNSDSPFAIERWSISWIPVPLTVPECVSVVRFGSLEGVLVPEVVWLD
jgi:hypothetical protein